MTGFFKLSILTMLCVVLLAGTAMATGSISSQGGTNFSVALEAMNAARTYTLVTPASANFTASGNLLGAPVLITTGQLLNSQSTMQVTFNNMAFSGSLVGLCQIVDATNSNSTNAVLISEATSTANVASINFGSMLVNPTIGSRLFITDNGSNSGLSGALNCNGSNGSLIVNLAGVAPLTSATTMTVTYTDSAGDAPTTPAVVANVVRKFTTGYTAKTSAIDYVYNAANGSQFLSASNLANAANVGITNAGLYTYDTTTLGSALSVTASLQLQDTAGWVGVSDVYLSAGSCGGYNTVLGGVNNALVSGVLTALGATGAENISISTGNGFDGNTVTSGSLNGASICIDVAGNQTIFPVLSSFSHLKLAYNTSSSIVSRVITGRLTVKAGGNNPFADAYRTLMTWSPNGYQGIVPYLRESAAYNTTCILSNQGSANAHVTFTTLTAESAASNQPSYSLGVLPAMSTMRVDIPGQNATSPTITYYNYTQDAAGSGYTVQTLTGINSTLDRFSGEFTIGASPSSITVNCIQADPLLQGGKRTVPVLRLQNLIIID